MASTCSVPGDTGRGCVGPDSAHHWLVCRLCPSCHVHGVATGSSCGLLVAPEHRGAHRRPCQPCRKCPRPRAPEELGAGSTPAKRSWSQEPLRNIRKRPSGRVWPPTLWCTALQQLSVTGARAQRRGSSGDRGTERRPGTRLALSEVEARAHSPPASGGSRGPTVRDTGPGGAEGALARVPHTWHHHFRMVSA